MEGTRGANPAVVAAHSNQEYPITVPGQPANSGQPPPPPPPTCQKFISPILKLSITAIFVFLGTIFFIIPSRVAPDFQVLSNSSISYFNITDSLIITTWEILVSVKNPSHYFRVKYGHVKAMIYIDDDLLCRSLTNDFLQGTRSRNIVRAVLNSTFPNTNDLLAIGLVSGFKQKELYAGFTFQARRRIGVGKWWIPTFDFSIDCSSLAFTFLEKDEKWSFVGRTGDCKMGILVYL